MKVVWSPRAIRHLTALRRYIEADNPDAAATVVARIVESVERLADQPHSGRTGRIAGTRELVVPGTPYVIPYRVRTGKLDLIAVFHGKQKWPKRL
jgi:addiction module RelE/StbE family toxin